MQLARARRRALALGAGSWLILAGAAPSPSLWAAPPKEFDEPADESRPADPDADAFEEAAPARRKTGAAKSSGGGPDVKAGFEVSGYTDTDAVWVLTPTVSGAVSDPAGDWSVGGRYLLDAVSAASVDVVATASGKWFEYRHVGSGSIDFKAGDLGVAVSGGVSLEPDYLSIAGGASFSIELYDKNITPSLAISLGHDESGRTGMPRDRWQDMNKVGVQGGVTFVVSRNTIAGVAADAILERGYLAKPYRYVPLFAPGDGDKVPVGASVSEVNALRLDIRPWDRLPDARDRFALTGRIAHRFDSSTLRADERLYVDSWGLKASTTDAKFLMDIGRSLLVWPHVRFHAQQAISFWQRAYEAIPGQGAYGIPSYRTGDRELGSLTMLTLGAGVKWAITSTWTVTLTADGFLNRFPNALYVKERRGVFSAVTVDATM